MYTLVVSYREEKRLAAKPHKTRYHWEVGEQNFDHIFSPLPSKCYGLMVHPLMLCFELANGEPAEAITFHACLGIENNHYISSSNEQIWNIKIPFFRKPLAMGWRGLRYTVRKNKYNTVRLLLHPKESNNNSIVILMYHLH